MPIAPDSKAHVIVQTLATQGLTFAQVAARFSVSERWVYGLARRDRLESAAGLAFTSKRPHCNSRAISFIIGSQIIGPRKQLLASGHDAGTESLAWNLAQAQVSAPGTSTIWRILREEGLVTAEPKKRPKAYTQRFEAVQKLDPAPEPFRIRHDVVDDYGKLSLRRAGKMHHMGVGVSNRGKAVTVIVSGRGIMVVEKATGEILGEYEIETSRNYWANKINLQEIRKQSEG